ncbi:hypothetical protein [Paenibacillus daejeonensis]|uniref:hypothetical protein n=1 Tax=Paenibacillus daejeonensis TaxID=135193 RepID=UPI000378A956|nr:hypothetical protein [Paenibacillus daejeonensis]
MQPKKWRHVIYLVLALGMLAIGLPELRFAAEWSAHVVFSFSWVLFVLLIIAANLYTLLGIDEETAKQLERVRLAKRLAWQRKLEQHAGKLLRAKGS